MPEKKNSVYPLVVLAVLCLGIFGPSYTQYQLAPLAPELIERLGLSVSDFTSVFSSPMIPAIFLSLVAGLLVDKFGIKKIIAIGLAVTAIGTCWRIWSDSYITLFLSMLLTGVGAAFLNANGAKIIGSTFPPEKVGSMMGIFLAASTLGMTAGTGTTALLPGIAVAYTVAAGSCGTAGGVVATLQLLGAVIIPTYVVGPIAGANISVFFTAAGVCMIFCFVFGFCLPELGRKKQAS